MIKAMFGYRIENGKTVIVKEQAKVLKQVAAHYIAGASLKSEAERLTTSKVEYAPGKWIWNKSRVRRLLTNRVYLGNADYQPILDHESFNEIQRIIQSRNTQKNHERQEVFSPSLTNILCGECGQIVERLYDARWKIHTHYFCRNPGCKKVYAIPDLNLWRKVKAMLEAAGEQTVKPSEEKRLKFYCLNKEIEHDLQSSDIDGKVMKKKILECAALQYALLDSEPIKSMDFRDESPCSLKLVQEIRRRVSAVFLDSNDKIRLLLADGRIVGEEVTEDGTEYCGRTTETDSDTNTADCNCKGKGEATPTASHRCLLSGIH